MVVVFVCEHPCVRIGCPPWLSSIWWSKIYPWASTFLISSVGVNGWVRVVLLLDPSVALVLLCLCLWLVVPVKLLQSLQLFGGVINLGSFSLFIPSDYVLVFLEELRLFLRLVTKGVESCSCSFRRSYPTFKSCDSSFPYLGIWQHFRYSNQTMMIDDVRIFILGFIK